MRVLFWVTLLFFRARSAPKGKKGKGKTEERLEKSTM